jgi:hypothetical protein
MQAMLLVSTAVYETLPTSYKWLDETIQRQTSYSFSKVGSKTQGMVDGCLS